ncbi:COMM domain-containing protein 4-like [Atheta coriaria]|uniref:COMM domain-containing protein 4-like n=1 Tax=Dalotia coriaria TaxID=877792 RepID=UPI0031F3A46E
MRFKFCGDADCPDWVLASINNLSKLSSVKLKQLTNVVAKGFGAPTLMMGNAEKLFSDSKLDPTISLKACIACIQYILYSTVRYNCDHNALNSELQQLGLPREHSTAIKKVIDDQAQEIHAILKSSSLKINPLQDVSLSIDDETNCAKMQLTINGNTRNVIMTPHTVDVLLDNLKRVQQTMVELNTAPNPLS